MPLFDRNKLVVTCDFDDNIVVLGGSITGTVNIFVLETVTLCGASLRYHVDESFTQQLNDHRSQPQLDKVSFNIEYVLFGHRSSRKAAPIAVKPGHYKYPFSIPVPADCPPSTTYSSRKGLKIVNGGPMMTISVDHRIDVNVYVANSLMDKQTTYSVPTVLKCVSPALLTSSVNGREGHLRKGMSTTLATKGTVLHALFSGFANATKEQADCDLFIYNTAVSLAETPFVHFAIRGTINCPYHIALVRRTSFGMFNHKNATEEVVSGITMPPLDSPDAGVRGKLIISSHALQSSATFAGKFVSCQFFVTLKLVYTSGVDAGIKEENRVCIPIDVSHGSLVAEAVPGLVAAINVVDGAVMGYTCPAGYTAGEYIPVGPVTESNVAPAAWGAHGPSELRYNRQAPTGANKDTNDNMKGRPSSSAATASAQPKRTEIPHDHFRPSDSTMMRGLDEAATAGGAAMIGGSGNANYTSSAPSQFQLPASDQQTPHFASPGAGYSNAANNSVVPPNAPRECTPSSSIAGGSVHHNPSSAPMTTPPHPAPTPASFSIDQRYDGVNAVTNSHGPIFDEQGRPIGTHQNPTEGGSSNGSSHSAKTAAPLPPQQS